jgi:hypothetical protein
MTSNHISDDLPAHSRQLTESTIRQPDIRLDLFEEWTDW